MKRTALFVALYILGAAIEPADAGELYLQGGAAYQFRNSPCKAAGGEPLNWCKWDRSIIAQPLAHLELGWAESAGRWQTTFYLRHESMPTLPDKGVNQAGVAVRFRLRGKP